MGLFGATAATGLYRLKKGDAVVQELLALQVGLDLLAKRISYLERAPFPDRMDRPQLEQMCRQYGVSAPKDAKDAVLREALKALAAPCGCGLGGIEAFFKKMGCEIQLEERPSRCIAVKGAVGGLFRDSKALCDMLAKLLPPDVAVAEELGVLTWDMFDEFDFSFDRLDTRDFTWTWLETSGHLLEDS